MTRESSGSRAGDTPFGQSFRRSRDEARRSPNTGGGARTADGEQPAPLAIRRRVRYRKGGRSPDMFANVLIANRGEIACRIIRTARGMGMRSIALHTPADRGALFTRLADEAHEIGEGANGYLDRAAILALAKAVGAECLHPGYGFLSENADFAEACAKAGVVFVGPPPDAMRTMG